MSPRRPSILMCPPDHYGIEYEINPWMNRSLGAVAALAFRQWQQLHDTLVALGVRVERMTPQPGLPDLVFTANAGLIFHDTFLSSRFRHEVRARDAIVEAAPGADDGLDGIDEEDYQPYQASADEGHGEAVPWVLRRYPGGDPIRQD